MVKENRDTTKDKQIDELKVNDKIIPKSDYNKYRN